MTRWYEDIVVDEAIPLGSHSFTEAEIIRFGRLYDPQYFHVDPDAAMLGPFGGLVASGWHTAAVGHRLMVDTLTAEAERLRQLGEKPGVSGPSPGVDRVAFERPVRPGDTIAFTLTVTGKRLSQSQPGWGLLFNAIDGTNQRGEAVYHAQVVAFTKRRDYRIPLRLGAVLAWRALRARLGRR